MPTVTPVCRQRWPLKMKKAWRGFKAGFFVSDGGVPRPWRHEQTDEQLPWPTVENNATRTPSKIRRLYLPCVHTARPCRADVSLLPLSRAAVAHLVITADVICLTRLGTPRLQPAISPRKCRWTHKIKFAGVINGTIRDCSRRWQLVQPTY